MSGLVALPLRSTQRYLSDLSSTDLVQTAHAPGIKGSLYAPSAAGVVALAGGKRRAKTYARAFHLDALRLAETLLRARSLIWARDFLATLATPGNGRLQWAVTPWDTRVGNAVLRLDGYGCVLWMGRYVLFAVVADPGGLAVEGYVPLFRNFARWSEQNQPVTRPVLVMLTTYARRAHQLSVLWQDVVGRATGATMFVTVFGDLMKWQRAGVAEQVPLWSNCRGSRAAIARPWPSLTPRPGARRVRVEDVTVWARGGAGRRRLVRAFVALTSKKWSVLEQVTRWPLLRSSDLALLSGYSSNGAGMVAGVLRKLQSEGLVEIVWESDAARCALELRRAQLRGRLARATGREAVEQLERRLVRIDDSLSQIVRDEEREEKRYVLSPLGLELLAATRGMSPLAYGRARLWPVKYEEIDGKRTAVLRTARYLLAWKHTLLVNEFFLGLRRLAEEQWRMLYRNHRLLIWDSVECRRWFWDDHRERQILLPDAGGVYQIGQERYEFWLEMDRGHSIAGEHGRALRRKYERYYLYRHRPDAIYGGSLPRLFVVTRQAGRAHQVQRVIMALAKERREPPLLVYVATLDDLWREPEWLSDGTLQPRPMGDDGDFGRPPRRMMWPGLRVWRKVDDFDRPTWCFEGLGSAPPGTQRGLDVVSLDLEVRAHSHRSAGQRRRRRRQER